MTMSDQTASPLPIGVLLSGGGSTLANLLERLADGRLRGLRIAVVISSRADVRGVEIARAANLPTQVIRPRDHAGPGEFSDAITACLAGAGVQLVAMAGFLSFWQIPPQFAGRVINIHPSLLPSFGGAGMHGLRVHDAVIAAGVRETGASVHVADNEAYDHGPVLARVRVPVDPTDTPETLAQRVLTAERELYPFVLQQIADNGLGWIAAQTGRPAVEFNQR